MLVENEAKAIIMGHRFEMNDEVTREKITNELYSFFNGNIGVQEFIVTCDETNNTPERIAANELWVDMAVRELGSSHFRYMPFKVGPETPDV